MVPTLHGDVFAPAWYVHVTDKNGHPVTYWVRGPHPTPESVMEHVRVHYPGVTPVSCERCHGPPTRILRHIPPTHFQHGILTAVKQELRGRSHSTLFQDVHRNLRNTMLAGPIVRQAVRRESMLRPPIARH